MNNQTEERSYMLALKELRRIISMTGDQRPDAIKGLKRGGSAAVDAFAGGMGVSKDVARTISDYAQDLRNTVRNHRGERRYKTGRSVIHNVMWDTRTLASDAVGEIVKRGHVEVIPSCDVVYRGAGKGSGRLHGKWEIALGPNWKRRVYDKGIALADTASGRVFIMQATPKSSAFLRDEGITVFDVEAYVSSASGGAQTGYVFKSAGPTGGSDFVVFHTDFMRGVTLIRSRITRGVLSELLG